MHPAIEIVSHCYAGSVPVYRQHLRFQIASLRKYPVRELVRLTVFATAADEGTVNMVQNMIPQMPDHVVIRLIQLPPEKLFRRSIGRNQVALEGDASIYWFTDCDYFFGQGCLDSVLDNMDAHSGLCYPAMVHINTTHEDGDAMIESSLKRGLLFPNIEPGRFTERRQRTCIGGVHIIGRDRLRTINPKTRTAYGYNNGSRRYQSEVDPAGGFCQCRGDVPFKKNMGPAQALPIRNTFRIRHSDAGRCFDDQGNRTVERKAGQTHD